MSKTRALTALAAILFTLVGAGMARADEALLQYKFEETKPLRYQLVMSSVSSFSLPDGQKEEQKMTNKMDLTQELIKKQDDGTFRVAVTVENATQTVNGEEKPFPAQPGPQILTMLATGEVVGAAGASPGAGGQMQMIFPAKPVKEGESWEQVGRIAQPLPFETVTKYTLVSASTPTPYGKAALIKSEMAIATEKGEGGEQVRSTTRGNLWFDTDKGRILKSEAKSNFKFDLPVQVPGMPNAQNVQVNLDLDLEIRLLDK